jgi:DNA-binding beta-propeller fold protein YncE
MYPPDQGVKMMKKIFAATLFTCVATFGSHAQTPAAKLIKTVTLPGYSGDFDHFAVDAKRNRLLVAAEDHATLEVFDLKTGDHLKTITGFGAPHSILVRPDRIIVTDSEKMTAVLNPDTLAKIGEIKLVPGADSAAYDAAHNVYYVVTGGKDVKMDKCYIEAINPDTGKELGKIEFNDNHVEAIVLDENGPRIFVNLAQTNKMDVVDRNNMKLIADWPVPPAKVNAMVAFDASQHRLYVVCRDPGMVVVMDSDSGKVISTAPAPLRADQVMYNAGAHLFYVPGGQGYMGIYDTSNPNMIKEVAKITTAPGAKTGILLEDQHKIVLAASPGDTKAMAKILTYQMQ